VHPAVEKQIPIYVKSNWDPEHPGTLICGTADTDRPVTTVTGTTIEAYDARHPTLPRVDVTVPQDDAASREACRTVISASHLAETIEALQRLQSVGLRRMGLDQTAALQRQIADLAQQVQGRVDDVREESEEADRAEVSAVAMVGSNVAEVPGIAEAVVGALEEAEIACTVPDRMNGSPDNFTVLVWSSERKAAIRALHERFVGKKFRRMAAMGANSFWGQQSKYAKRGGKKIDADFLRPKARREAQG
jgi:aspartokinase